jgi:hypothetical protein
MPGIPTRLYLLLFLSILLFPPLLNLWRDCSRLSEMLSLTSLLPSRDRSPLQNRDEKMTRFNRETRSYWLLDITSCHLDPPPPNISAKFHLPFTISSPVGAQAFRLDLPQTVKVHLLFHVSHLKPMYHPLLRQDRKILRCCIQIKLVGFS